MYKYSLCASIIFYLTTICFNRKQDNYLALEHGLNELWNIYTYFLLQIYIDLIPVIIKM